MILFTCITFGINKPSKKNGVIFPLFEQNLQSSKL